MIKFQSRVLEIHFYTESVFYIRFERKGLQFRAGQYLVLSLPDTIESREYSISSGENDEWLEVLVKDVELGKFSSKLKKLNIGDLLEVEGASGFFVLREYEIKSNEFVFIATGTGISPFNSFIRTQPDLKYKLMHGVRNSKEIYGNELFSLKNSTICTSRDSNGDFTGRVTQYLSKKGCDKEKIYYLCGNSAMINDVSDILEEAGVPVRNIRSEVFF